MAAKMNCHGLSSDQIADVLNQDTRTIETWLNAIGKKVEKLFVCPSVKLVFCVDELWSYIGNKSHQLWVF